MTDEVLKRRLIGAAVLLLGAVVLASLLPEPGSEQLPEGVSVVTLGLDSPPAPAAPPADAPGETPPASPQPLPEELPPAPDESEAPPLDAVENAPATANEPPPQLAAVAPAAPPPVQAQPAAPSRPSLRLEPAIVQRPAPAAAEPAKPAPAASPPASPPKPAATPAPGPSWTVQVGSFGDIANARVLQDKLKAAGLDSILSPVETDKGTLYRVRTGGYARREDAAAALARVQALGHAQATVVEN